MRMPRPQKKMMMREFSKQRLQTRTVSQTANVQSSWRSSRFNRTLKMLLDNQHSLSILHSDSQPNHNRTYSPSQLISTMHLVNRHRANIILTANYSANPNIIDSDSLTQTRTVSASQHKLELFMDNKLNQAYSVKSKHAGICIRPARYSPAIHFKAAGIRFVCARHWLHE